MWDFKVRPFWKIHYFLSLLSSVSIYYVLYGPVYPPEMLFIKSVRKRNWKKFYKFFINEKLKKLSHFSSVFYPILCLMKSLKNFEKISVLEVRLLVFLWDVKILFGEKYAWFVNEILIQWSKSCLQDMLWSQKNYLNITQNISSENPNY